MFQFKFYFVTDFVIDKGETKPILMREYSNVHIFLIIYRFNIISNVLKDKWRNIRRQIDIIQHKCFLKNKHKYESVNKRISTQNTGTFLKGKQ